MTGLVLLHVGCAMGVAWVLRRQRRERLVELAVVWLVPIVGPFMGALQLLFEHLFERRSRVSWERMYHEEEAARVSTTDVCAELSVAALWDVFESGDELRLNRTIRRMVEWGDPRALARLRHALGHRDARVRSSVRAHLIHAEDELLRRLRGAQEARERGRTYRSLAALSPDSTTSWQRLSQARHAFREAGPDGALEHGQVLLELGEWEEALHAFQTVLDLRPGDADATSGAGEARFRLRGVAHP